MSLQAYMFELECDHEGCKATLIKATADEILEAGWQVVREGYDDREWIEVGDKTFCPDHSVEGRGVFAVLIPLPGSPRGCPIGEAAVKLDMELP